MKFRNKTALAVLVAVCAMGVMTASAFALEGKPIVETKAATNVTSIEAQLHGVVNPEGLLTHYHFEYGTTKSYGKSTTVTSAGHGTSNVEVSAALTGLATHTTYQYRITAENAEGVVDGANMQFTTYGTPEFKPAGGQSITGSIGAVKFRVYGGTITCAKGTSTGSASGASTATKIVLTLTGCKGKTTLGTECEEQTIGAKQPGEMVSQSLRGQLGIVTTSEAASGVGLYVEAEAEPSNATWFQDDEICMPDPKIFGTAAAEVVTIGKAQSTNELVFAGKIRKLTLASGKTATVELLSWNSEIATIEAADAVKLGETTEVT